MSINTSTIIYEEDDDGYIYPIIQNNELNQEDAVVRSPSPEITFQRNICISGNNIEVDTKIPKGTLSPEFIRKIYRSTMQDKIITQSLKVLLDQDGNPVLITAEGIAKTKAVETSAPNETNTTANNIITRELPVVSFKNTTTKRSFIEDEITTNTNTTIYENDNIPTPSRKKH